ncbi:MAG: hypothetical protein K0R52_169 [Alphaproteobacteria bacterium]|jgi:hypothetical protein|nr:hypothetical protein [Alphaproteobacteria bacterium]
MFVSLYKLVRSFFMPRSKHYVKKRERLNEGLAVSMAYFLNTDYSPNRQAYPFIRCVKEG